MTDLTRFLDAQAPVYEQALAELRSGRKRSHWMWFVFPQLVNLGRSPTAQYFALADIDQAQEYLSHPVLGTRLRECVMALNRQVGVTAEQILGFPDCLKLRSCLTLFREAAPDEALFAQALAKYYDGTADSATLLLLRTDG